MSRFITESAALALADSKPSTQQSDLPYDPRPLHELLAANQQAKDAQKAALFSHTNSVSVHIDENDIEWMQQIHRERIEREEREKVETERGIDVWNRERERIEAAEREEEKKKREKNIKDMPTKENAIAKPKTSNKKGIQGLIIKKKRPTEPSTGAPKAENLCEPPLQNINPETSSQQIPSPTKAVPTTIMQAHSTKKSSALSALGNYSDDSD